MNVFDDFSQAYDLMFPWETRRKNEGDFYSRLFMERGVRSVLDCACGTGMHAIDFASAGLASYGSDLSPKMIERAMERALREGVLVNLRVASFTELTKRFDIDERFDAVICTGNSLTLAASEREVATALREMHEVLNPGGTCVVHIFNWEKLEREGLRIMPAARAVAEGREVTFLRVFHHRGDSIDLHIVVMSGADGDVRTQVLTAHQRPVTPGALVRMAKDAGFVSPETYGGFDRRAFGDDSDNLILIAGKGR